MPLRVRPSVSIRTVLVPYGYSSPTLLPRTVRSVNLSMSSKSTTSPDQSPVVKSAASSNRTSDGEQQAAIAREPARRRIANVDCILKHLGVKKTQVQPCTTPKSKSFYSSDSIQQPETSPPRISICTSKQHEPDPVRGRMQHRSGSPPQINQMSDVELLVDTECSKLLKEHSLPTSFGKREVSHTRKLQSSTHSLKHEDWGGKKGSRNSKRFVDIESFDICPSGTEECVTTQPETEDGLFLRSPEDMKDQFWGGPKQRVLRPGMVLLKNYISRSDQVFIVRKCRELGVGQGGFYQPGYKDGAKLRLLMMCLGLDWDPQTRKYGKRRRIDRSKPPDIPPEFRLLVETALHVSHTLIGKDITGCNAEEILPFMSPDICIVNFYTETGRLGLHQDRDESMESLAKGLPVVSFSVGDSAEFLYGNQRDPNKAEKVVLESGDVLIFGGESRHVFHGVASIIPNSAPEFLLQETGLRPGRLNLTFRQY